MTDHLDSLAAAVDSARQLWGPEPIDVLAPARLIRLNEDLANAQRLLDAARTRVAAEIARQSRPDLGAESLAKQHGFRNPTALIAAVSGTSTGDAARLVKVGEATAPRVTLTGQPAPARHPHVAAGLTTGRIGAAASSAIITVLDKVAIRAGFEAVDEAERMLVEKAPGLAADQLARLITRVEAWLDPDGVAPREDELRTARSLNVYEDRHGAIVIDGRLDPERGAPLLVALDAMVKADLRAQQDECDPDAVRRTMPQMRADALARLAEHALGCAQRELPLDGATVVVRIGHAELVEGVGCASIDGIATPISVATARRMAAGGGVISCVLGADSEILDWGRLKRLFTPAQKLALVERDGGCAMCGAPPSHTKAHHLRWWARDAGPTDLSNGVLLCEACHHRIHDNGWEIRIQGVGVRAKVWFIPPRHVDPTATPRLGGRARFDVAA